ncbi:hypothetical protein ACVW17_003257 [Bradyrhizobium sp. USDA 4473]
MIILPFRLQAMPPISFCALRSSGGMTSIVPDQRGAVAAYDLAGIRPGDVIRVRLSSCRARGPTDLRSFQMGRAISPSSANPESSVEDATDQRPEAGFCHGTCEQQSHSRDGRSSRNGRGTCRLLVAEGAKVVITDILHTQGQGLAARLGESAICVRQGNNQSGEWTEAIVSAERRLDALYGPVNNAGSPVWPP